MKCSICGKEIKGYECNAWPLAEGYCCQKCDCDSVLPVRIFLTGATKNQILVLKTDNTIEMRSIDDELSLKQAQEIVEGYIELVPKRDPYFYYIVNEEGLLKELEENALAKRLFGMRLVGNLIVCPKNLFK